jgi:hypothetical protein
MLILASLDVEWVEKISSSFVYCTVYRQVVVGRKDLSEADWQEMCEKLWCFSHYCCCWEKPGGWGSTDFSS